MKQVIISWSDWVTYRKLGNKVIRGQSDVEKPHYRGRTLSITKNQDGYIFLVAVLHPAKGGNKKSAQSIARAKLIEFVRSGDVEAIVDKEGNLVPKSGLTMFTRPYMNLVYNDPACYDNIYGPIPPENIEEVVNKLYQ